MKHVARLVLAGTYLAIGVFVSKTHGYDLGNLDNWRALLSGFLAVLLWPLVLFRVPFHIRH